MNINNQDIVIVIHFILYIFLELINDEAVKKLARIFSYIHSVVQKYRVSGYTFDP